MGKVILAAGGIVLHGGKVAIIYRRKHDDWTLPKGKLEPGESFEAAAVREVREETGCKTRILSLVDSVDYRVKKGPKKVRFYAMEVVERRPFQSNDEIERLEWVTPKAALPRLTYSLERRVLKRWIASRSSGNREAIPGEDRRTSEYPFG